MSVFSIVVDIVGIIFGLLYTSVFIFKWNLGYKIVSFVSRERAYIPYSRSLRDIMIGILLILLGVSGINMLLYL